MVHKYFCIWCSYAYSFGGVGYRKVNYSEKDKVHRSISPINHREHSETEKKFSKTELVKKPFEAKKKLYQSMEKHLDEALDKVNSLAKEPERMKDVEMAEPSILEAVAEPEYQYGAEAYEAYQQSAKAETAVVSEVKTSEIKGKSR